MEKTLERVKKAVAGYRPKQKDNELRISRSLLAALSECKKYINDNSQTDRGCAQRIAREITELVAELPTFQNILADKKIAHRLHTRQLAEEHLELLQKHLEGIVKEEEKGKINLIHEWVKQHSVFDELKGVIKKSLPKNAYVLLFAQKRDDEELDLVTRTSADGRVFTRFRLQDFTNDVKLHKSFNRQPAIVGAAVIAERELLSLIGKAPEAKENSDQIRTLLAISSEKASKPAKQFVEMNAVLKELHQLSCDRTIPKDAYVLLFQANAASDGDDEITIADESSDVVAQHAVPEQGNESATNDESANNEISAIDDSATSDESTNDAISAIDESSSGDESTNDAISAIDESSSSDESTNDEISAIDESSSSDESTNDENSTNDQLSAHEESPTSEESSTQASGDPTLVVKKNKEGKIVTRFWGVDFAVSHRLFDAFRGKPSIVGAAIIKGTEIVQILGRVPTPDHGQSQLDALLNVSRSSIEKPFMDFLEDNDVLKGLHGLAKTDDARLKDAQVIFFGETDGAKVKVVYPRPGNSRAPILLNEFQSAKVVHDRFARKPKLAGASVVGISKPHNSNRAHQAANKGGGPSDSTKRRAPAPVDKPVVLAAFGRTPLKANLLATPEILQRLGIDIELY